MSSSTSRTRRRRRSAAIAAASVAALGGAVIWATAAEAPADGLPVVAAPADTPHIAALTRARTPDAASLAARYANDSIARTLGLRTGAIRRASSDPGVPVYAVPTDRGWLCVAMVLPENGNVPGLSCNREASLGTAPTWLGTKVGGTTIVGVIVPDGYTEVTVDGVTARVEGNAALVRGARDIDSITARGPGLRTLAFP